MQKLSFLRIGLVLNLLEDAVGRLAQRERARSRTAGLQLITVRSTTLDVFYCDFLYLIYIFNELMNISHSNLALHL